MATISWRHFEQTARLASELAQTLVELACQPRAMDPFALLLAGGQTPLAAYRLAGESLHAEAATLRQARRPVRRASPLCYVAFTDERLVPPTSADSNYHNARPFLDGLALPPERILRVQTELGAAPAAAALDRTLGQFFARGGRLRLAVLGLGADGHTCSLFSVADARRTDCLAFAVPAHLGHERVTVGAAVLARAERVLFVVTGQSKAEVLRRLRHAPETLPAGVAVAGHAAVEVWTDVPADAVAVAPQEGP